MITIIIDDFEGDKPVKSISSGTCKNEGDGKEHGYLLVQGECLRCLEDRHPLLREIGDNAKAH